MQDQRRDTRVDVDRRPAREVDRRQLVGDSSRRRSPEASAAVERGHPDARQREVHHRDPEPREQQPAAELDAVGDRTQISATVMIANINWNATNTVAGNVNTSGMLTTSAASTPAAGSAITSAAA